MKKTQKYITFFPVFSVFKPVGIPLKDLEAVTLTLDEFEAIRLADFLGYYQEKAAEMMGVSRQTFGRILDSAHKKIAEAIVFGKCLKIEEGENIMPTVRIFLCEDCKKTLNIPFDIPKPMICPECGSPYIHRFDRWRGRGKGKCRRNRWGQK